MVPTSSESASVDAANVAAGPRRRGVTGSLDTPLTSVLLLGVMWGTAYLWIKIALHSFDTWEITFLRLVIAALVLTWAASREQGVGAPADRKVWGGLIAFAVVGTVLPFMLITWSITSVPTSTAAISNATTPLFTLVIAISLGRESRPSGLRAVGTTMGFLGVGLMFGLGFGGGDPVARVALFLAAFGYACGFVIAGGPAFRPRPPSWLARRQMMIAATLMLPAALTSAIAEPPHLELDPLLAILAIGVFSTGLPALVQIRAVRNFGSSSASLATYVVPVVGAAAGVFFLGEHVGFLAILGGSVTLAGVVLAERGRR
ncbi:MAG: DMT family transporter [Actinobacteria bacterium]|nr:DMT family transporter [Actinomycetota bacterium]